MEKGESSLVKMFFVFSLLLFVFFMADLSFSYISVYTVANGQILISPVINMIPTL